VTASNRPIGRFQEAYANNCGCRQFGRLTAESSRCQHPCGTRTNRDDEEPASARRCEKALRSGRSRIAIIRRPDSSRWTWWLIAGSPLPAAHIHSLVPTDIASGWIVPAALVVREQTRVTVTVEAIRAQLSFPLLGLDVDNDSVHQRNADGLL
jgi:hypothetical protein